MGTGFLRSSYRNGSHQARLSGDPRPADSSAETADGPNPFRPAKGPDWGAAFLGPSRDARRLRLL
jgi:hypothetical protein